MGVPAVDRLTIVAHDKFQDIIDDANNPNSIIKTGVYIGRDIAGERKEVVTVEPFIVQIISGGADGQEVIPFVTKSEQEVARFTYDSIRRLERLPNAVNLKSDAVKAEMVREYRAIYNPLQGALDGIEAPVDVETLVEKSINLYIKQTIDIPKIIVVPTGEVTSGYHDFDLEIGDYRPQPVERAILVEHLRTHERYRLMIAEAAILETRLEDNLIRTLIDYTDICYDEQSTLLYKLAGQMVNYLQSYLSTEDEVRNVLQFHHKKLAEIIHAQLQSHFWEKAVGYEAYVSKGFTQPKPAYHSHITGQSVRNFRTPVENPLDIRGMLFGGFSRCIYPVQRFHTDTERRFAMLCENENEQLKWFKPASDQFQIEYNRGQLYEPDFVVETESLKLICEPKRAGEMHDEVVLAKARAASLWCKRATTHAHENGGKPWAYLLIPHDAITAASTLHGLIAEYTFESNE